MKINLLIQGWFTYTYKYKLDIAKPNCTPFTNLE